MEEPKSGIYQIRNILDNKVYIGSAKILKSRWTTHLWQLENNKHHNIHLQRAYNKYGKENFIFEILYRTNDINELIEKENYFILITNCLNQEFGYNICEVAGSSLGRIASEETRQKLSRAKKGKPKSEETRKKMSNYQRNKTIPERERIRLKTLNIGRKSSEEAKKNMSLGQKGRCAGSKNPMAKLTEDIVLQIKKMIYEGMRNVDIGKIFGISHKQVSSIRNGDIWRQIIYDPSSI